MRSAQMTEFILNEMQEFDQQVPIAGPVAEKFQNLAMRLIFQLTAFGGFAPLALTGFPNAFAIVQRCHDDLHFVLPQMAAFH
jgi:hypothetical protein